MPQRRLSRRGVLKLGLLGVPAAAAVASGGAFGWMWASAGTDTVGRVAFTNRLAIPPLVPARHDDAGRRVFDLRATVGQRQFRAGRPTVTWGINGDYLAPTLRADRGETVLVNVRNELPEATTLHWHGMHLPARMDGGPHQVIEPGATWSPSWTIDQPAATLWYHPHSHQRTAQHVYRGIAGLFILDDSGATPPGLPSKYGVDDIPVIVQDKRFDDDNQLDERHPTMSGVGILGETICVNGTTAPYHDVMTERVRLGLLNASNARVYRFGLADDRPFALIGTDGGLLATPQQTTRVQLSPSERAEVVATLRPGERVVLRSHPPDLGVNPWDDRFSGGDDTFDILELRAADELAPAPPLPDELAAPPQIDASAPAATRAFHLSGSEINGRSMDMGRIDFAAVKDTTEIWEITASDDVAHNFHVHDVQLHVMSIDGAAPPPELRGWKDTIFMPPNRSARLALRVSEHTDPDAPYMYHCHLLSHEDQGLMAQFVVEAGQRAGTPVAGDWGCQLPRPKPPELTSLATRGW